MNISYSLLSNKKNLLAFSAGIDSSALFFILIENSVPFDIAIVDYGTRKQSKQEVSCAVSLAKKYNIKCYTTKAPSFNSSFEKNARDFRYNFFEELIRKYKYNNLLTAHQLNDQLEWLLMRLCKGAGVSELVGMEPVSQRKDYMLMRPLLEYSKQELQDYLDRNDYPYFVDTSNIDQKHERNRFRKQFSNPMISNFKNGIKKSFRYLRHDQEYILNSFETICSKGELRIIRLQNYIAKTKAVDISLKELGYLLSSAQRDEIDKQSSLVIGGKWAVELQNNMIYIAPFLTADMPKQFKEQCRQLKIPEKIRPYLYQYDIDLDFLTYK